MNIYLGKNRNRQSLNADIKEIGHLLIAGKTGTGKTEFIGAMIRDFINKYDSNAVKFCLFGDCWFLLQDKIPTEYLFYGRKKSIATDESETQDLLNTVLHDMAARIHEAKKGEMQDFNDCCEFSLAPEIVLLFDNNAFYLGDELNDKIAQIIVYGNDIGMHVVFSLQNVVKRYDNMTDRFPSVLCGQFCEEKKFKKISGRKDMKELEQFEFVLRTADFSDIVKCEVDDAKLNCLKKV